MFDEIKQVIIGITGAVAILVICGLLLYTGNYIARIL